MYNPDLSTTARLEALEARVAALESALQPPVPDDVDPSTPEGLWDWLRKNRSKTTLLTVLTVLSADELYNVPELSLRQLMDVAGEQLTRGQLRAGLASLTNDGLLRSETTSGPWAITAELLALYTLDDERLMREASLSVRTRATRAWLPFTPSF